MKLEEKIRKRMELELPIRMILEMRFGDGTGNNPQITMATNELINLFNGQISKKNKSGLPKNRKGTTINIYKGGE